MWLDLRSNTEWSAYYSGRYDEVALGFIQRLLSRLDCDFLDVGGNIGMYSIRVSTILGPDRKVICIEPMPTNVLRIRQNAILNGLQERIIVNEIALSDAEGETDLVLREDFELGSETGNASIAISNDADGDFRRIRVHLRRFDALRVEKGWSNNPVAKVDIEGHEDFFFRGAATWLSEERPIIITEINNWFYQKRGTTSSEVFSGSLPEDYKYALLRDRRGACELQKCSVEDLASFRRVETCVIYPTERADDITFAVG